MGIINSTLKTQNATHFISAKKLSITVILAYIVKFKKEITDVLLYDNYFMNLDKEMELQQLK